MAQSISNNETVTSTSAEKEYLLSNAIESPTTLVICTVLSGTIKFSVGEVIVSGHHAYAQGEKAYFTVTSFKDGTQNLRSSGDGTFFVNW